MIVEGRQPVCFKCRQKRHIKKMCSLYITEQANDIVNDVDKEKEPNNKETEYELGITDA